MKTPTQPVDYWLDETSCARLREYIDSPLHHTGDERSEDGPFPPLAPQVYEQDWNDGMLRRITDHSRDPLTFIDTPIFAKAFAAIVVVFFVIWAIGMAAL